MTNSSQLWQFRFKGQASPFTTGWKVQNPPSARVLRRVRSIARGFGFLAGHRFAAGQQDARLGGAGAGDPEGLEGALQVGIGVGEVDVVLGHLVGDLSQVALDVGEVGAVLEEVRREGVAGLVRDAFGDDAERVDPPRKLVLNQL